MESNHEIALASTPTVSVPASEVAVVEDILHHTISIPEPHVCRICDDDEDKDGEGLVELGCQCKGEMSRMHKTCFLEWFGTRILLRDNYDCEVCNSKLAFENQMLVAQAVSDHVNGGRKIIMKALQSELGQRAFLSAERAANFDELVQVLTEVNAPMLRRNPRLPSLFPPPLFHRWGQGIAMDEGMQADRNEAGPDIDVAICALAVLALIVIFFVVVAFKEGALRLVM